MLGSTDGDGGFDLGAEERLPGSRVSVMKSAVAGARRRSAPGRMKICDEKIRFQKCFAGLGATESVKLHWNCRFF